MTQMVKQQAIHRSFSRVGSGCNVMEDAIRTREKAMKLNVKYVGCKSSNVPITERCFVSPKEYRMDFDLDDAQSLINMDVDDIHIGDDVEPPDDEPDMAPSAVQLITLLQHTTSGSTEWTHLVKQPETMRCCIVDPKAAGDLYRAVWRYGDSAISVMERRLSPLTRLSVEVRLGTHQLVASRTSELDLIVTFMRTVRVDLQGVVSYNRLPECALTCFVLRDPRSEVVQRYWFHWPGLVFSNRELTPEWCRQRWTALLSERVREVVPRNQASYVPMYGCRSGWERYVSSHPDVKTRTNPPCWYVMWLSGDIHTRVCGVHLNPTPSETFTRIGLPGW